MNRKELNEFLIEELCDDWNTAVEFLNMPELMRLLVKRAIENLDNEEFRETWHEYYPYSIEDQIFRCLED